VKFIPARLVSPGLCFVLLLLGVCFGVTGTSMAQNQYYVNASAGSDSNDGSQARPWKTIQHADAALSLGSGGTIVHVAAGTYNGPITTNKSGTPSGRIVFLSDTKWGAKITTANWSANGSYVDVNGFDMTSPAAGNNFGMEAHGNSIHILNNYFHDFDLTGCGQFGILNLGTGQGTVYSDIWVIGNIIRRISTFSQGTYSCVTAHAIYDFSVRSVIQNNIMSAITGPAIQTITEPGENNPAHVISNNTIFNSGGGIIIGESPGVPWDYGTINNNIIVNNTNPSGGSGGINYYHVTGTHNVTFNNLIYGNQPADLMHHNTPCGNGATGIPISGSDAEGNAGGCPSTNPKSDASVAVTFVNFQVDTPSSPASNFNPDNYQIKAGSNAIQGGSTSCAAAPGLSPCVPTTDMVGILRPASSLSIGPFEQGTVAGVPAAPTGLTASVQ
jgi:hypothetical protein